MAIMLNNEITTHVKINLGNSIVIGPGKIELLKEINKKGSISAAARSLKMSYKKYLKCNLREIKNHKPQRQMS